MAIFANTRKISQIFRRNGNACVFALQDAAQRLACKLCNFALQSPHTRFTRVITDDVTHCVVADRKLIFLQTMGFDLLFNQMPLGNLKLFVLGIAFQTDDLHSI